MKKMCYLLTMGLLVGSLTVPVFAASGYRYRYRLQTI